MIMGTKKDRQRQTGLDPTALQSESLGSARGYQTLLLALLGIAWVTAFHFTLLKSGYLLDDVYNSQITGALIHLKMTVWERTVAEVEGWIKGAGRLYPLSAWTYTLFHWVHSVVAFKAIALAAVGFSVLLFSLLVLSLTESLPLAVLSVLFGTSLLQYRDWFDPILAFCFLLPVVSSLLFTSWWLWAKYLNTKSLTAMIGSVFFLLLALLTYELSYPMGLGHFLISWATLKRFRFALRAVLPVFLVTGFIVVLAFALRSPLNPYFKNAYLGSNLSLHFPQNWAAFKVQMAAPLPWVYSLKVGDLPWRNFLGWEDAFSLGLASGLVAASLARLNRSLTTSLKLVTLGAALWTLPAALIALSGHRENIANGGFGIGYLPVYLQYFGVGLVLLSLFALLAPPSWGVNPSATNRSKFFQVHRVFFAALGSLLFAGVASFHLGQNRLVVSKTNATFLYPRRVTEAALKAGLMEKIEDEIFLVRNERFDFDHSWFFSTHSKKKVHAMQEAELLERLIQLPPRLFFLGEKEFGPLPRISRFRQNLGLPTYVLTYQYDAQAGERGFVYFAQLDEGRFDRATRRVQGLWARRVRIYDLSTQRIFQETASEGTAFDFLKLFALSREYPQDWRKILTQAQARLAQ
jgi:hypothetical protein